MNSIKLEKMRMDSVTSATVDGWFANLNSILTRFNLLDKPQQIFNCDEFGFRDDPGKKKVIVSRETKYANKLVDHLFTEEHEVPFNVYMFFLEFMSVVVKNVQQC